jgi:hypothetical protein
MPTQKISTKTLKSKISLEKRLQFYSLITRKSEDYLSNILGKEMFQSLKNCELTGPEIQQINQDLISIIQSEDQNTDIESGNNNLEKEIASKNYFASTRVGNLQRINFRIFTFSKSRNWQYYRIKCLLKRAC